jgi:hypothetical protein
LKFVLIGSNFNIVAGTKKYPLITSSSAILSYQAFFNFFSFLGTYFFATQHIFTYKQAWFLSSHVPILFLFLKWFRNFVLDFSTTPFPGSSKKIAIENSVALVVFGYFIPFEVALFLLENLVRLV